MEFEPTLRSRRAVIGAALGGAAAATVGALALPVSVAAHDVDDVQLGVPNTAAAPTSVENTDPAVGAVSLAGTHSGGGTAIRGASVSGVGVIGAIGDETTLGDLSGSGVVGYSDATNGFIGTLGYSDGFVGMLGSGIIGVYGSASSIGVAADGADAGVFGQTMTGGIAVVGLIGTGPDTMPASVGVFACGTDAGTTALQVSGKVKFSRSGRISIGGTATTKTKTMSGVTTSSYIIATMQTSVSGVYVRAVVPASGSFKIYLSKAAGKTVYVGYLVVN